MNPNVNLSLDTALGSMQLVADMARKGMLDALNVSQHEFERFIGDEPWTAPERVRMGTVLHAFMNASGDYMGLPRFTLSAEWAAAAITVFVAGVNVQSACHMVTDARPVEDKARMSSIDAVQPERIFAIVQLIYGTAQRGSARALFSKKTGIALEKVLSKTKGEN